MKARTHRAATGAIRAAAAIILSLLLVLCCFASAAKAQVDVTGSWSGFYDFGSGPTSIAFTLTQEGTVVTGLAPGDSTQATILGDIDGTALAIRFGFTELAYSFDLTAQTDGFAILGTIIDSNAQSGTFSASRIGGGASPPLTKSTVITDPPGVTVADRNVTVTMIKFKKPVFTARQQRALIRAKRPRGSVQYEVSIKGAERRKIISKRNVVTARNLKPGTYQVTYRATALKDGKRAFSTKPSPTASFTVRGD